MLAAASGLFRSPYICRVWRAQAIKLLQVPTLSTRSNIRHEPCHPPDILGLRQPHDELLALHLGPFESFLQCHQGLRCSNRIIFLCLGVFTLPCPGWISHGVRLLHWHLASA